MLRAVAEFLDQAGLETSLFALTGELQRRFRCSRVVLGLMDGRGTMQVAAISQQSEFESGSAQVQLLAGAMVEACDQDVVIHHPGAEQRWCIADSHRALAAARADVELCTVPLCYQERSIGALLFERTTTQPWSRLTVGLFSQIAVLIAPMIALRQRGERSFRQVLGDDLREWLGRLLGPRHLLVKGAGLLAGMLLVLTQCLPVVHRVTAAGELVPLERRVITAPIMGYIESVAVRPGERVSAGQVLARLDTRDLGLERSRWQSEMGSTEIELRSAMAAYDRKAMAVAQARQGQARAQLELIDKQIARASIRAPSDGIVVAGDLTQALGAPVERGEMLLELAPEQVSRCACAWTSAKSG